MKQKVRTQCLQEWLEIEGRNFQKGGLTKGGTLMSTYKLPLNMDYSRTAGGPSGEKKTKHNTKTKQIEGQRAKQISPAVHFKKEIVEVQTRQRGFFINISGLRGYKVVTNLKMIQILPNKYLKSTTITNLKEIKRQPVCNE